MGVAFQVGQRVQAAFQAGRREQLVEIPLCGQHPADRESQFLVDIGIRLRRSSEPHRMGFFRPQRTEFAGQSKFHVLDLAGRHVLGDYLEHDPSDVFRVDVGVVPESCGNMGQELLPLPLSAGVPAGCQPS